MNDIALPWILPGGVTENISIFGILCKKILMTCIYLCEYVKQQTEGNRVKRQTSK
jgi:hypothetical protein